MFQRVLYTIFMAFVFLNVLFTVTVHADSKRLFPGDATVYESNPFVNYGYDEVLSVGAQSMRTHSYFMFDLSQLPKNIEIINATLSLYKIESFGEFPRNYSVYVVRTRFWDEFFVNWYDQPCGQEFNNERLCNITSLDINIITYVNGRYYWNVTGVIKRFYGSNVTLLPLSIKDDNIIVGSWSAFSSVQTRFLSEKPYILVSYVPKLNITLNAPTEKVYINTTNIDFNCSVFGVVGVKNVTLFTNFYKGWRPLITNSSGIINTSYVFSVSAPKNDTFTWNCKAVDMNNNSWWGVNYTFRVDTSRNIPELILISTTPPNPYTNLTIFSEWWGHLTPITHGIAEEDSAGVFLNHSVQPDRGRINYTALSDNLKRNQVVQFRFYANNSAGWNVSVWKSVTVFDYWEPQDVYFQRLKKNNDYIKTYLYNPVADGFVLPVKHDADQKHTFIRPVQSHAMLGAALIYLNTRDVNYLDLANDIGYWIANRQVDDGYYRQELGGGDDPVDSLYTSVAVAENMLFLGSVAGDVSFQISAEKSYQYYMNNSWSGDHFRDYPNDTKGPRINFNAHAAGAYAYACSVTGKKQYCEYANKTAYWLRSVQLDNGSWPYRSTWYTPQPEAYQAMTIKGFAKDLYWLKRSGYYRDVPAELRITLDKAFEYLNDVSNSGDYFYNSDGSSPGQALNMMQFAMMFSYLAALEHNSTYANWTWKQLDYMLDIAPGKQNEDGSWNSGDMTQIRGNVSTYFTSYTEGFFAETLQMQNKPREFVIIHENVSWHTDEPQGRITLTLNKNNGYLDFEKTIHSLNVNGTTLASWDWNITEQLNFSDAHVSAQDTEGEIELTWKQEGSLFKMNASRSGVWREDEEKALTYMIKSKNLNPVERRIMSDSVIFIFTDNIGNLTTRAFRVLLPANFVPDGTVIYKPSKGETMTFFDGINATITQDGKYAAVQLDYFVPLIKNRQGMLIISGMFEGPEIYSGEANAVIQENGKIPALSVVGAFSLGFLVPVFLLGIKNYGEMVK